MCLFIGSPVYRDVAIAPVINFIEDLPQLEGNYAVPFVTWGQACSGVALWQMSAALIKKGFRIADHIRERVTTINELPLTQVFLQNKRLLEYFDNFLP